MVSTSYKTNSKDDDWTDDELKETVWDNMIPHTGVESGPNEDIRF